MVTIPQRVESAELHAISIYFRVVYFNTLSLHNVTFFYSGKARVIIQMLMPFHLFCIVLCVITPEGGCSAKPRKTASLNMTAKFYLIPSK